MEFYTERTSASTWYKQPCEEAKEIKRGEYTIEINTLEQLLDFVNKYGEVIIFPKDYRGSLPTIEIYDGWRE